MKNPRKSDRGWIGALIALNLLLLFLAQNHYHAIRLLSDPALSFQNESSDTTPDRRLASIASLEELTKLAKNGSWEQFETLRLEEAARVLQQNLRISPGEALYFFPETLPQNSMSRDFAIYELKPKIDALRKARKKSSISNAYQKLKTKVLNYELGAIQDPSELSDDAKLFLKLYWEFTERTR